MGRYIGPSCRLCRREGMKLFLKGNRCYMAKCPIERGRPAPGMHGQRGSKLSDYGVQLREKQRLRRHYGMQEGQFRLFFERALRRRGDNVVYRLGFALSRRASRQFVLHRHVAVNGRTVSIPSMVLKPGAKIEIRDRKQGRAYAKTALEAAEGRQVSPWLTLDKEHQRGEVLRVPTREEIAPFVNEQLVVELYSK